MFNLAKNSHWLQTQTVRAIAWLHPAIRHNIEKVLALKKAFYLVNLEDVSGDYLEFGMYEGTSFIGAFECHMRTRQSLAQQRSFWGFDSFGGFKYYRENDTHPFFREGDFKSSYTKTRRRVARHFGNRAKWNIFSGYVEDTVGGKQPTDLNISKVAVAFIDVDLGEPTRVALDFLAPALQEGSVIIFDDYFAYRGSLGLGVAGAFEAFRKKHPEFVFRRLLDYGYGGQGFILATKNGS
jgi:hypothetical protein